jgi:hypothetical protein
MKRHPYFFRLGVTLLTFAVWAIGRPAVASERTQALAGDEPVQHLTLTITLDPSGEDLDEPLALDLGLGFPFWLHPVGRASDQLAPFGAVPQQTTATTKIAAGESARFNFSATGDAGPDVLGTTRLLLDGVQVADISRIGLASPRTSNWTLAGYELKVNGKLLAAIDSGTRQPDASQTALIAKLALVEEKGQLLTEEYEKLQAAVQADTATPDQLSRLQEVESEGRSLLQQRDMLRGQLQVNPMSAQATREADLAELQKLNRDIATLVSELLPDSQSPEDDPPKVQDQISHDQRSAASASEAVQSRLDALRQQERLVTKRLQGQYPWFIDEQFVSPHRAETAIREAKVTLETCNHEGADTQNYVFFSTGGHKYLLNEQFTQLSAEAGPQEFEVDLLAGPLTAADLRRWAVGTLAVPIAQSATPDRWHPQRVVVEIDDSIVYDSDESSLDRQSLEAVRVIPPIQLDGEGVPVANSPSSREVYVWKAGAALGLDLANGGALPLPDMAADEYPDAEPDLVDPADADTELGDADDSVDPGFSPDFPPFPGETFPGTDWSSGNSGSSWLKGNSSNDWLGKGTGDGMPEGAGQGNPPIPRGKDFQVNKVWISQGWKLDDSFTIDWEVAGDTSEIDHFRVSMRVVRPDQSEGFFRHVVTPTNVSVGQRSCVVQIDKSISTQEPYYYVAPCVTAVTKDLGKQNPQSDGTIGPARAVFPPSANHSVQPVPRDFTYQTSGSSPSSPLPIKAQPSSGGNQPSVWFAGDPTTPDAIQIGVAKPGSHLAVRPQHNQAMTVRCEVPGFSGQQQLVAHVGFMGATNAVDSFDVQMTCDLIGSGTSYTYSWKGKVSTNTPLQLVSQTLKPSALGVPMEKAEIKFTFTGGGWTDPTCTPGIYGLRLFPHAGDGGPEKPVIADLVIDKTASYLVPGDIRVLGGQKQTGPVRQPSLVVKNDGPQDIPPAVLKKVKAYVIYYLGQYGNAWGDIHTPGHRTIVQCGPYSLTEELRLPDGTKWQGPLKVGQSMTLVPVDDLQFNKWTGADGKIRATKKLYSNHSNAFKLFMTFANLHLPGPALLKDPNPDNSWHHDLTSPTIIGRGPLDFEVLAFQQSGFQGTAECYELNPDTQRQRLIWHLGQIPGKVDMYQKVGSLMVGSWVDLFAAEENHFYSTSLSCWTVSLFGGGPFKPDGMPKIGSMIICPKEIGPIGVEVRHNGGWKNLGFTWDHYRSMFFALPEKKTDTTVQAAFSGPLGFFNDNVDLVYAWRTWEDSPAVYTPPGGNPVATKVPDAWMALTLYEHHYSGSKCTLAPPFRADKYKWAGQGRNRYDLTKWLWNKTLGKPGIDDEVTSFKAELINFKSKY